MKGIIIDLKDISDSREVMESKESPKIRWFIYILLFVVVSAIILLCSFDIDEYSKSSGEIRTSDASSAVISSSSCKLKEIRVSEGQHVSCGDVLFVLDVDYAKDQKELLTEKLTGYTNDLKNTELLKKSIEEGENYFSNDSSDSKYYYRYEQYLNGILLTEQEINNSQESNNMSEADNENSLATILSSIDEKSGRLNEYRNLLDCVYNDYSYDGGNELVYASYCEYDTSFQKAKLLRDEYWSTYESLLAKYNDSLTKIPISSFDVENAKSEYDTAYAAATSYHTAFLSDVRSQLLLIENQLISDSENETLVTAYNDYTALKSAVEQGTDFVTSNEELLSYYNTYTETYSQLCDDCNTKYTTYQELYTSYAEQSNNVVTEDDVDNAYTSYESAQLDVDSIKNNFIFQIQSTISQLEDEIKTLESNKESIQISLEGADNLEEYERLSGDKLKNDAIITINSEIDALQDNIDSIESQMIEVNETIKNAEITALYDGTVTLVEELNIGDIVQAGNPLCSVVPDSDELRVVLYIPENEISKLAVGQNVEYTFDAMPYSEYGRITGEIISISADAVVNETSGAKYYIAQANLSAMSLKNKQGDIREVKTGMLVEAKVISGSKKAIVWLLEKINLWD